MAKIKKISAYQIIDSRGYPTIEGKLLLDNGIEVVTSIPAGISIGKYEAVELRDNDPKKFDGFGVSQAIMYINDLIGPKLVGVSPAKQQEVDGWLCKADGTKNKSKLGANTLLTVSQLLVKAAAKDENLKLFEYINKLYTAVTKDQIKVEKIPTPIFNVINGGRHANNGLDFQEFQVVPSSSLSFIESYEMAVELYHELKRVLQYRNAETVVGEEGGLAPRMTSNNEAFEVINEAINRKDLKPGLDVFIGTDMASSHFYNSDRFKVAEKANPMKVEEFSSYICELSKKYAFLLIEDPFPEDDWKSWSKLNSSISSGIYIVGDDLTTTNKDRLSTAIKENACSAILIKPNQVGTVSETLEVVHMARLNKISYIVSHRAAETNDSFIADFAVGLQSEFVKFGAPARGERVAKYNRLAEIEREELGI